MATNNQETEMIRVTSQTEEGPRDFIAVIVRQGERSEGRPQAEIRQDTIEIWDATRADDGVFGPLGQFVSAYWLTQATGEDRWAWSEHGLCLDGGNAHVWTLDAAAVAQLMTFAKGFAAASS